jgi:hypothetical protein
MDPAGDEAEEHVRLLGAIDAAATRVVDPGNGGVASHPAAAVPPASGTAGMGPSPPLPAARDERPAPAGDGGAAVNVHVADVPPPPGTEGMPPSVIAGAVPNTGAAAPPVTAPTAAVAAKLAELLSALKQGLLTDAEFDSVSRRIQRAHGGGGGVAAQRKKPALTRRLSVQDRVAAIHAQEKAQQQGGSGAK